MSKRRELQFNKLDEVVEEAERLASGEYRTTGNHSFAQILKHLALTHDMSTGKVEAPRPPFFMRMMVKIMKPMIINDKPLKPGFKLPQKSQTFFWPEGEIDIHEALAHLKESVERYKSEGPLPKHPVFGALTRAENEALNCRHGALHLSFVHPA